jgi:F-type H+-transporting ATPase subunit delta
VADEATGVSGLAGRYATAVFELSRQEDSLDAVAADLAALGAMLDASEDLRRLVRSPVIARDDQGRALAAVAEAAGLAPLTRKFLGLLARNRRLFALADIIRDFETLIAAHRGEVAAEVTSAVALDDGQLAWLRTVLAAALGRDVLVRPKVDSSLLGGLVVKIGSRMVDSSLKSKLQGLRLAMKGVG